MKATPVPESGPQVAEDHRLDVHRGAEVVWDVFAAAVDAGTFAVPGAEDRADGPVELFEGVLRELLSRLAADDALELLDDVGQFLRVQGVVVGHGQRGLMGSDDPFEQPGVHPHHAVAEHLEQAAVGVPGEPLPSGRLGKAGHGVVVETDVEDGVHHPGHRETRSGTNGHQQRIVGPPEIAPQGTLQVRQCMGHLHAELRRFLTGLQIHPARLRGDGEAGRHRQFEPSHLGQAGTLATEQGSHLPAALGELVHVLGRCAHLASGLSLVRHDGHGAADLVDDGVGDGTRCGPTVRSVTR
ncbi:hypothetical protein SPURM210S_06694 [Streptomyces purpurascens]